MPTPTPPSIKFDPLSPFSTPKKFRATSTKDLSGLLTPHRHSPAASSPLRNATTPRKRGAEEDGEDNEATPTKRVRTGLRDASGAQGEEGQEEGKEGEGEDGGEPQTPSRRASARAEAKRREREGAAAFFALRPGASAPKPTEATQKDAEPAPQLATVDLQAEIDAVLGRRQRRRVRPRRDWVFREEMWAPKVEEVGRILAEVDGQDGSGSGSARKGKEKDVAENFGEQVAAVILAAYA